MVESLGGLELTMAITQRLLTATAIAGVSFLARSCPSILVKLEWFLWGLTLHFPRHEGLIYKLVIFGLRRIHRVVHFVCISSKR